MLSLILYNVDLSCVEPSERKEIVDRLDPVSYTGVSSDRSYSSISFYLDSKVPLSSVIEFPPGCSVSVSGNNS